MDEKNWKDPSPWVPMTRPIDQKHIGKFLEELGECVEATAQIELGGKWEKLENEIADVKCGIILCRDHFGLVNPEGLKYRGGAPLLPTLQRELGNAIAAASRCFIQGIQECEPVTKKPNRDWLQEACGQLLLTFGLVEGAFQLDRERIRERTKFKRQHLQAWHAMLAEPGPSALDQYDPDCIPGS